jgi:hypothetical protein
MIDVKGLLFASGRPFLSSDETQPTDLIEISGINGRKQFRAAQCYSTVISVSESENRRE